MGRCKEVRGACLLQVLYDKEADLHPFRNLLERNMLCLRSVKQRDPRGAAAGFLKGGSNLGLHAKTGVFGPNVKKSLGPILHRVPKRSTPQVSAHH